jgi:hypothetical protein
MAKKFLTAQDIEQAASQGVTEITLDRNTKLTDLAREAAQRLGVRFVDAGQVAAPDAPSTSTPPALHQQIRAAVIAQLGAEPAGLDEIIKRVLHAVEEQE